MQNFRLDLTTLRIFLAVARLSNITRAAEHVHVASSAVSKRLSDLEEEIGAKLFYRMPRGVELTPAGEALLHHAQNIFESIEQLTGELSDYAKGSKGHVRMMVNQSSIIQFLPRDLKAFSDQYPEVKIDLREENSGAIAKAVSEGQIDVGVAVYSGQHEDLQAFEYRTDELVLIAPTDHPLATKKRIRFEEAVEYDFVGLEAASALDSLLLRAADDVGGALRVRFRVTSFDAVYRMVAARLGVGMGPIGMLSLTAPDQVCAIYLDEPWAKRQLSILVRNFDFLSAPAKLMVNHLRAQRAEAA